MSSCPSIAHQIKLVKLNSVLELVALVEQQALTLKEQIKLQTEVCRLSTQVLSTNSSIPHPLPRRALLGVCACPDQGLMHQIRLQAQRHRQVTTVQQVSRERLLRWVATR